LKITIEIDKTLNEGQIVIKCRQLDERTEKIQKAAAQILDTERSMTFYKGDTAYYIKLGDILFFETAQNRIYAHSADDIYLVKYKLYELEETLGENFVRISKSAIVNTRSVRSLKKNITSSSLIEFHSSHKQVYASRYYLKNLELTLKGRSL